MRRRLRGIKCLRGNREICRRGKSGNVRIERRINCNALATIVPKVAAISTAAAKVGGINQSTAVCIQFRYESVVAVDSRRFIGGLERTGSSGEVTLTCFESGATR